jgi:hypothetical protein
MAMSTSRCKDATGDKRYRGRRDAANVVKTHKHRGDFKEW